MRSTDGKIYIEYDLICHVVGWETWKARPKVFAWIGMLLLDGMMGGFNYQVMDFIEWRLILRGLWF